MAKVIKAAWIEQILEFDSQKELDVYVHNLESGRPQKFKIMDEPGEPGKVTIRIRKQYNNNVFPD